MQRIDFLPKHYKEKYEKRENQIWAMTLIGCFGAVIIIAATYQGILWRSTSSLLSSIEPQHTEAVAREKQHEELKANMSSEQAKSQLFSFLGHPWPVSQVLSLIAEKAPQNVTLMRLSLYRQKQQQNIRFNLSGEENNPAQQEGVQAALLDLKTLQNEIADKQTFIMVTGTAVDSVELYQFVSALNSSPLLEQASLKSMQQVTNSLGATENSFELQLILKQPYGSPNGPAEPPTELVKKVAQEDEA